MQEIKKNKKKTERKKSNTGRKLVSEGRKISWFLSLWFEPSQPQRIISELKEKEEKEHTNKTREREKGTLLSNYFCSKQIHWSICFFFYVRSFTAVSIQIVSYLTLNAKKTAKVVSVGNKIRQITSQSPIHFTGYGLHYVWRGLWKIKLNDSRRQAFERQNSWRQAKHEKLFWPSLKVCELLIALCSPQRDLNFCFDGPQRDYQIWLVR